MDRIHVQNNQIRGRYSSESGRITLAGGGFASPIIIGWVSPDGKDKVLPVEEVVNDFSTTNNTTETRTETIMEDRVVITRTIQDKQPNSSEVNAERERRIKSGFTYAGHTFDYDDFSKENITGAATLARFAIMNGAEEGDYRWMSPNVDFTWITKDNEVVPLDAFEMVEIGDTAAAWVQAHVFAARALKDDENGIPLDYAEDIYWP